MTDYVTGQPIAAAGVRVSVATSVVGGIQVLEARTDQDGRFAVHWRGEPGATVTAEQVGYSAFTGQFLASAWPAGVRLRRIPDGYVPLPSGSLRVGARRDGTVYGWSFGSSDRVPWGTDTGLPGSCAEADLLGVIAQSVPGRTLHLRSCGAGGIAFTPAAALGVTDDYLVYADSAPAGGYAADVLLNVHGSGGVYFVRTRDGMHYAKFEFDPSGWGGFSEPHLAWDVILQFVYNPSGGRGLVYVNFGTNGPPPSAIR